MKHLHLDERLALHDALRALPQRRWRQVLSAGGRPLLDALPCSDSLVLCGRLLLQKQKRASSDSEVQSFFRPDVLCS